MLNGRRQKEEMEDVAINSDRDRRRQEEGKKKNAAEASKVIINNERHRNTPDAARVCVWECVCERVCVAVFGFSTIWPCSLDVALLYFYMQVGAD